MINQTMKNPSSTTSPFPLHRHFSLSAVGWGFFAALVMLAASCSEPGKEGSTTPPSSSNAAARVKAVIKANTNEGSRRAALQALADEYGRAGFDPSVAFLEALPADDSSRGAFHTITHHIAMAEPARCLSVFTSRYDAFPDGWIRSALSNTAMTWGGQDPEAAFDAYRDFDGFKFPAERQEYLGEILAILHKVDPAQAMKEIEQLGDPKLQATLKDLFESSSE